MLLAIISLPAPALLLKSSKSDRLGGSSSGVSYTVLNRHYVLETYRWNGLKNCRDVNKEEGKGLGLGEVTMGSHFSWKKQSIVMD